MTDLCPCFDFSKHTYALDPDGVWRCKHCYATKPNSGN